MANEKFTAEQIIEAIKGDGEEFKGSYGIKSEIANRLRCDRHTVDRYIEKYATVRRAYEEERERPVDMAEAQHFKKVQEGHWPSIRYMLSTRGKDRGYVERQEIDQDVYSESKHHLTIDFSNVPDALLRALIETEAGDEEASKD